MDITKSFTWNGATITARRAKVRDRLAVDAVQTKLTDKNTDMPSIMAVREFGRILSQSTVDGDAQTALGFMLPSPAAPADVLDHAFRQWLDADAELMDIWQKALREVDSSLTGDSEKKQTAASANSSS